jgi:hypothetical protein
MIGAFATRIFRIVFILAGFYNLAFGLWAALWPGQFFQIFQIVPPHYPQIWACVGMIVGVYGLLYWYAAWKPDRAKPIIAIGLLGKVLGPVGMIMNISAQWPRRLAMLNLYNDVIWWVPFALFLLRDIGAIKKLVRFTPEFGAGLHLLGLIAMALVLRPGMATQPIAFQRAIYISQHSELWTMAWSIWMLCAMSLVGMYIWWGSRLSSWRIAMTGIALAALGCLCDLSGESLGVLVLVERGAWAVTHPIYWDRPAFEVCERIITLLTAGFANAFYTIGGMVLMWQTPNLPQSLRLAMWGTWLAGIVMTVAAFFNCVPGMIVATVVLFPLLILWMLGLSQYWRRA